jgi:phospholipase/carboxylesterase
MQYTHRQTEHEVTLEPRAPAVASIVLLHGLGADGTDFVPIVDELRLPDALPTRFVFPHAPLRPVTVNAGYVMRAWYDIRSFTAEGRADAAGLAQSVGRINGYLRDEIARGISASRIVLAGFSQGGAVALAAGLRFPERLAGILALSAYLPFPQTLAAERSAANANVPILMCHGRLDPVVHLTLGQEARDVLTTLSYPVEWHEYPMQHEVCAAEIAEVGRWIEERFREDPFTTKGAKR